MSNTSISITWHIEDVLNIRPDLTDAEAFEVLKICEREHDAEVGISWETLEYAANENYPEKTDDDVRKYKIKVGRKNVELCYIEIEALSERHATEEVEKLIIAGEFKDKTFTTTAITGEKIYDVAEVSSGETYERF